MAVTTQNYRDNGNLISDLTGQHSSQGGKADA